METYGAGQATLQITLSPATTFAAFPTCAEAAAASPGELPLGVPGTYTAGFQSPGLNRPTALYMPFETSCDALGVISVSRACPFPSATITTGCGGPSLASASANGFGIARFSPGSYVINVDATAPMSCSSEVRLELDPPGPLPTNVTCATAAPLPFTPNTAPSFETRLLNNPLGRGGAFISHYYRVTNDATRNFVIGTGVPGDVTYYQGITDITVRADCGDPDAGSLCQSTGGPATRTCYLPSAPPGDYVVAITGREGVRYRVYAHAL
jgi:hypothetical protein